MFRFVKIQIFRENYSPHFYRPSLSIRYKYNFPIPSSNNPARYLKKKKNLRKPYTLPYTIYFLYTITFENQFYRSRYDDRASDKFSSSSNRSRERTFSIDTRLYIHTYIYIYRTRKVCPSIEINKGERNNNRGIMYDCARSISKKSFSTRN